MTARALRQSDGVTVIELLHVCRKAGDRMRGLLGRKNPLADREGMWFPRCRLIHTFGMKFPIDLVYLDERLEVCKVIEAMPPARLSACLAADSVMELRAGAARALGLSRGIRLLIVE